MSLPQSHRLHQLSLLAALRHLRAHQIWLQQRQIINDLRARELQNARRTRTTQDILEYGCSEKDDRLRKAMERLYAVRESQPLFSTYLACPELLPELQRGALKCFAVSAGALFSDLEQQSADDQDIVSRPSVVNIQLPSGATIRAIPRRPGAPSSALPH